MIEGGVVQMGKSFFYPSTGKSYTMKPVIYTKDHLGRYHFCGNEEEESFDVDPMILVDVGSLCIMDIIYQRVTEEWGGAWCASYWDYPPKWGPGYDADLYTYVDHNNLDFRGTPFELRYNAHFIPRHVKNIHRLAILEGEMWEGCKSFVPFKNPLPDGYQGVWDDLSPWLGSGRRFMEVLNSGSSFELIE